MNTQIQLKIFPLRYTVDLRIDIFIFISDQYWYSKKKLFKKVKPLDTTDLTASATWVNGDKFEMTWTQLGMPWTGHRIPS